VLAASGDDHAWSALWEELEPWLRRVIVQPRFVRRLDRREGRNIVIDVIARMRANQYERLKLYLDARRDTPTLSFKAWLRVVAKRASIDYARERIGGAPATVRPLLELAATRLHEPHLSAVELWVQGIPLAAIADELGLADAASTGPLVQSAIAQLVAIELVAERRSAEALRERELSCARFELEIAAAATSPSLDEHLRQCAPCRGVAETIIELSLRE
jgi:DNA-directed RNA polymerase specialized sigma24 family protein